MKSIPRILILGVACWAIPFAAGIMLFPLQSHHPSLFDTCMALAVCLAGCGMGLLLMKKLSEPSRRDALLIGLVWAAICLAIDVPIFTFAMGMSLHHYAADVGLTYLMLPAILWSLGTARRMGQPSLEQRA